MDVVFMMQESGTGEPGSHGDHALYLAASRLANNLRAVSNAFNYLHTTAHGTREYICASAHLKLLINDLVFCGRTRTGKPLFSRLGRREGRRRPELRVRKDRLPGHPRRQY